MGFALCSFVIGGKHRIRNETYLAISPADFQSVVAPWLLYFPYLIVYANAIPMSTFILIMLPPIGILLPFQYLDLP
jgi:hypothetical protein